MTRDRRGLFYLGLLVPELVRLTMQYGFAASWHFQAPTHSLVGAALMGYLVAHLWPRDERAAAFTWLAAGAGLHLAVDALVLAREQWGPFLLYPFVHREFALGWYTAEQAAIALPVVVVVIALFEVRRA